MKKLQLKTGQTGRYLSENPKLKIMTPLGYTNSLMIKKLVSMDSHNESGRWCLNEENE